MAISYCSKSKSSLNQNDVCECCLSNAPGLANLKKKMPIPGRKEERCAELKVCELGRAEDPERGRRGERCRRGGRRELKNIWKRAAGGACSEDQTLERSSSSWKTCTSVDGNCGWEVVQIGIMKANAMGCGAGR